MMDPSQVLQIAVTSSSRYRKIMLQRPGKEPRPVWQPSSELRLIQRWCADRLFSLLPVHKSCFSYVKDRSIAKHAARHRTTRYLSRVDITGFFPSIRRHNIQSLLTRNKSALSIEAPADVDFLSNLVTRGDSLVIGSPSSPVLSNAIMYDFDRKWSEICEQQEVIYSRYADDIYISANLPGILSGLLINLKHDLVSMPGLRFSINEKKNVFTSRKRLRRVTGIVLTPDQKLSIGRHEKRKIKSLIHQALNRKLGYQEIQSLLGRLSFVDGVEPTFALSLRRKYGEAFRKELASLLKAAQPNPTPPGKSEAT
jgi:RNA-directed DNA polymerase